MELVKGFQKLTVEKDVIATYNVLVGQLDRNMRELEKGYQLLAGLLTGVSKGRVGTVTLVAGAFTVLDSQITNKSLIFLTCQITDGAAGFLKVSDRVEGESFDILSSNAGDLSVVGYLILEPN